MRKSVVTWRLSFSAAPDAARLKEIGKLLAPVVRATRPDDFAVVQREYGWSDYLYHSAESEFTAGELALDCLKKAHRLGNGWRISWPGGEALWPEALDGLQGYFERSSSHASSHFPDLAGASFNVSILAEKRRQAEPSARQPAAEAEMPQVSAEIEKAANEVFLKQVAPALGNLLFRFRTTAWSWECDAARRQLQCFGYRPNDEDDEAFAGPAGELCRVHCEGDAVGWIEFVLCAFPDPHLLDEVRFSAKQSECELLFRNAVRYAAALLGKPAFCGGSGEEGFPSDQWADWAAVWPSGGCRLMIQQKHNDPELPMEVCLVFAVNKAVDRL